jgi:hypothetical protein
MSTLGTMSRQNPLALILRWIEAGLAALGESYLDSIASTYSPVRFGCKALDHCDNQEICERATLYCPLLYADYQ